MDWDLAIKRNSEVLAGIVETLFRHAGARRRSRGFADSAGPPTGRAACSPPRRIRRCAVSSSLRPVVLWLKPACPVPNPAGSVKTKKGAGFHVPPSSSSIRKTRIVLPRRRKSPRAVPRIHFFNNDGEFITIGPPIRPAKAPAPAPQVR